MSWDVFVSHNRQDKPWVRVFVQHLRELGLRVFFDEDSISVGGEFHREVSEALEPGLRSKYFRCSGWGVGDGWCVAVRAFGPSSRMPAPVSDYRQ